MGGRCTFTSMVTIAAGLLSALGGKDVRAGQYVSVSDDLQLYYEDAGQGPPMVWVPGWTASEVVFEHQIEHFSNAHRVIAYDPRSQGLSTKTLEHNDYAQHGRDLAALIDKLGLRGVTLVGWSAGCYDAYAYVRAKGTDNLRAFVCIDMPPKGFSADLDDWSAMTPAAEDLADLRGGLDQIASDRRALFVDLATMMNARELTPQETDWFVRQAMLTPTYAMLALRLDWTFSDYVTEAKQMDGKLPVLQIVSERMAKFATPWLAANTPHAESFPIKRHMSFWSEPESFNAGLDAFLTKVR
jgi:non-heme chloroperoxidase